MSRPPFPITAKSPHLRLIKTAQDNNQPRPEHRPALIIRGLAYPAETLMDADEEGCVSGQNLTLTSGSADASPTQTAFVWDNDALPASQLAANEFQLMKSALEGPEILAGANGSWLSILAVFHVRYLARDYAVRLGEVRLVSSKRLLTLEDGSTLVLQDSEDDALLYLQDHEDQQVVRQQAPWQPQGSTRDHVFDYRIEQFLPRQASGLAVKSVTVLEQFCSYFMERPLSDVPENSIWVPAYAPISWGWSMRVEPTDSSWTISRRKLMPPVVGHEGWQLPQWQSNTLSGSDQL
ncbi:hypothetical protein [Oceanobacter mangrovi]|uniref:hypothetical protein n=1 Tax=Oceanobacter mangrovi TaxID=2862510 RepID=UPI001C8D8F49|nr:hypothetical protein [Oceanobacter mangrovi]